jgi:photosystem II stability/assembly factor-like uncharacterized protein
VHSPTSVTRPWRGVLAGSAFALAAIVASCTTQTPPSVLPSPPIASPIPTPTSVAELTPVPTAPADPATFRPAVVAFRDSAHGLAGGSLGTDQALGGAVASTSDGGATWTIQRRFPTSVGDLAIVGREAWALIPCPEVPAPTCGDLFHSTDDGRSWDLLPSVGEVPVGPPMSFVSATTGWAVGTALDSGGTLPGLGRNRLLQTSDGGRTWSAGPIPCGPDWTDLVSTRFVDGRHGWAVCSGEGSGTMAPTEVLETRDGGTTWTTRSSASSFGGPVRLVGRPPGGPVGGAFFTRGGRGWVWQGRSGTERSLDGGTTWAASGPARAEEEFVSSMWFVSDKTGFAVYSSTELQSLVLGVTDDGGGHWRTVKSWPNG